MSVAKNIASLRGGLPTGVTLVAVSKTHPAEAVREAWEAGQRDFGENRPQELAAKHAALAGSEGQEGLDGLRWHMIGHLQTNKVRLIAPFVEMIHSVDSARLAGTISREAERLGRRIDCLLEIRIAREESKHGWQWDELRAWLETDEWRTLTGIRFRGVMGVATFTDDQTIVRGEFQRLRAMFRELGERFFDPGLFDVLSMGMSDDYKTAAECGTTMVRIGSLIFGSRRSQ